LVWGLGRRVMDGAWVGWVMRWAWVGVSCSSLYY